MRTITIDLTYEDLQMLQSMLYGGEGCRNFKEWHFNTDDGEPIEVEFINDEEYEERNK